MMTSPFIHKGAAIQAYAPEMFMAKVSWQTACKCCIVAGPLNQTHEVVSPASRGDCFLIVEE